MTTEPPIDWPTLHRAAADAAAHAYAPYSDFPVGAAGLVDDGRVVTGCNVENASYGLTLCAECGMVGDLHRTGGGRLVAAVATDPDGRLLAPCGRCRQLLIEAGGPTLVVDGPGGPRPITELLADPFTAANLVPGDQDQPS
jgi:cytidine deaminase